MIGIGEGLAIMSVCAPVTVAIIKFVPPRNTPNLLNGTYVKKDLCDERSRNIQEDIREIKEMIEKVFDKLEAKP